MESALNPNLRKYTLRKHSSITQAVAPVSAGIIVPRNDGTKSLVQAITTYRTIVSLYCYVTNKPETLLTECVFMIYKKILNKLMFARVNMTYHSS